MGVLEKISDELKTYFLYRILFEETGKTTVMRKIAVRDTGVSRDHNSRPLLITLRPSQHYRFVGFKGIIQSGSHYTEKLQFL